MNLKTFPLALVVSARSVLSVEAASPAVATPPMGWNSFDSYGVYLYHDAAVKNIDEMARRYKQFGYEYFVIDAGWFGEFKLKQGTLYPLERHAEEVNINEYGILQPSQCYFPHGLKILADRCHEQGLKFGIHLMRGIPRKAVVLNTPVKGTKYTSRDIADTTSICVWCPQNYGIDMRKPGAQEYYNSVIDQLAEWGVDFVKYDDIVPFPLEVEGVANAIARCKRPIVLSLSPGGKVDMEAIDFFKKANMLRVTNDIWDEQIGIDQCFDAWRKWQGKESESFYVDMDMIPFGELVIMSQKPDELSGEETNQEIRQRQRKGELANVELLSGKGWHRRSKLSKDQHYTFITLRALSASPLMIGGDMVSMDDFAFGLLTNKDMLECNQNGVMGSLIFDENLLEAWKVNKKGHNSGWFGIFNRNLETPQSVTVNDKITGLNHLKSYKLHDIWSDSKVNAGDKLTIAPGGVLFVKFNK